MIELRIIVDSEEVREAAALFATWAPRRSQLPTWLRDEFDVIMTAMQTLDVKHAAGPVYEVILPGRLRALVGNLRARD